MPPKKDGRKDNPESGEAENSEVENQADGEPEPHNAEGETSDDALTPAGTNGPAAADGQIQIRSQQYLISHTRQPLPQGVVPLNFERISESIEQGVAGIKHVRTLKPPSRELVPQSAGAAAPQSILVVEMTEEHAEYLSKQPQLRVEKNLPLQLPRAPAPNLQIRDPSVLFPQAFGFNTSITVTSRGGAGLEGVEVFVFGAWQNGGITDKDGKVDLTLFGETPASIRGLYLKPKLDYWDMWIPQPRIIPDQNNVISLRPLDEWDEFTDFPGKEVIGWGYRAMKIDQLPAEYDGTGIKVAVVDSGAATSHQDLKQQVKEGFDVVAAKKKGWEQDSISHGSHCAGVIAGKNNRRGIRGIAPKAELFVYKVFPGGQFDHLIDALDRCIEADVDVVNLSLGADEPSEWVEERLTAAKNAGIACIVAAGNSAGPVKYPASSSNVLAVSAIGKTNTFPADSYHNQQIFAAPTEEGYFSAKFTCFGPEVGVCAPGVAILSSVPANNYASWDGTSMAGPHVAGLAALLLAHHPDLKNHPKNAERVDRLFQLLKQSAQPLDLGDPNRSGAGLPDAVRAFDQTPQPGRPSGSSGSGSGSLNSELDDLLADLKAAGLR